jgi:hypothetical protein
MAISEEEIPDFHKTFKGRDSRAGAFVQRPKGEDIKRNPSEAKDYR